MTVESILMIKLRFQPLEHRTYQYWHVFFSFFAFKFFLFSFRYFFFTFKFFRAQGVKFDRIQIKLEKKPKELDKEAGNDISADMKVLVAALD